jgi:hypothetical protein
METNLKIYIDNLRECYLLTEWLANCVAKKIKQNKEVSIEHLANCATMKKIIAIAKNTIKKYGEQMPTKEEVKEISYNHAKHIIEEFAPYC